MMIMSLLDKEVRKTPIKDFPVNINIDGKTIEVDKECEDMVLLLNKFGYPTIMSCQGHNNRKGRNSFRIWFDRCISDEKMMDLIKKVGEWKAVYLVKDENNENHVKVKEIRRGIDGWIFKRHYYIEGELVSQWIYEAMEDSVEDSIYQARKDYLKMKCLLENYDIINIYNENKSLMEKRAAKINNHYDKTGKSFFSKK